MSDPPYCQWRIIDLDLKQLLTASQADLKTLGIAIENQHSGDDAVIYRFSWTSGTYDLIPALDSIAPAAVDIVTPDDCFDLARKYWERREASPMRDPFGAAEYRLALHIRQGDSLDIQIAGKCVSLMGGVMESTAAVDEILAVDPNRKPIPVASYSGLLNEILRMLGSQRISICVLSDGFDRTYSVLLHALEKGNPALAGVSRGDISAAVARSQREFRQAFSRCENVSFIIGETMPKLHQSIHAMASADLVVWGHGGFAHFAHTLLRQRERPSVMMNVRHGNAANLQKLGTFLRA
jgi:hypothetical protein